MKWAKYFGLLLLSFCLFFGLSPLKHVNAAERLPVTSYGFYIVYSEPLYSIYLYGFNIQQITDYSTTVVRVKYAVRFNTGTYYRSLEEAIAAGHSIGQSYVGNNQSYLFDYYNFTKDMQNDPSKLYVYNMPGSENTDNEEEEDPSWWDNVKDAFSEFVTSGALADVLSGDWIGYINEVLFGDLWTVKVGEGEDEIAQFYTVSATPSPSPTPTPTQIPVQVNIDPTTGNITYHYNINVSGTPIPTSSPVNPNPPVGSGGYGSELTEPFGVTDYYEPDDSLSIPNLRIFQFQLDLPGSNSDIGVDSLDNNVEVMNGYLEDNADAITTVSSFFQVIPSDWFLLLGAIACFPIIAAMIKSLLGG